MRSIYTKQWSTIHRRKIRNPIIVLGQTTKRISKNGANKAKGKFRISQADAFNNKK